MVLGTSGPGFKKVPRRLSIIRLGVSLWGSECYNFLQKKILKFESWIRERI